MKNQEETTIPRIITFNVNGNYKFNIGPITENDWMVFIANCVKFKNDVIEAVHFYQSLITENDILKQIHRNMNIIISEDFNDINKLDSMGLIDREGFMRRKHMEFSNLNDSINKVSVMVNEALDLKSELLS